MYGNGKIIRKKKQKQERKRGFSFLSICFWGFHKKFIRFRDIAMSLRKTYDDSIQKTGQTIADPPRHLLNLNLNYEKLRHKNRQISLFRNIRDPYFCIFQDKYLFPEIIEGNPCLEIGGIPDDLKNLSIAETVMLDSLPCTKLQNRGRDEL